jgi:hypothetical protein
LEPTIETLEVFMFLSFLFTVTASAQPVINSWEEIVSLPEVKGEYWQEQRQLLMEECSYDLAFCKEVYNAEPKATRNPSLYRFTDSELLSPSLYPVHLARFYDTETPEHVRIALLDLLRRTESQWEQGLIYALNDPSPVIRINIADITRYASSDFAKHVLFELTSDDSEEVRAAAFRGIGYQQEINFQELLENGLLDNSSLVRLTAVKSIGRSQTPVAMVKLTPLLVDEDSQVRLHSLRTIARLYPAEAPRLKQVPLMQQDSDAKVRAEATRVLNL